MHNIVGLGSRALRYRRKRGGGRDGEGERRRRPDPLSRPSADREGNEDND